MKEWSVLVYVVRIVSSLSVTSRFLLLAWSLVGVYQEYVTSRESRRELLVQQLALSKVRCPNIFKVIQLTKIYQNFHLNYICKIP